MTSAGRFTLKVAEPRVESNPQPSAYKDANP
jgi:hypothetical protein